MTTPSAPPIAREAHPAFNPDPIKAVSVISTGTTQIHPQHAYGSRIPTYAWILGSRRWTPPRPINVYLIDHADGLVLFDLGQDRASVTDPDTYFPGQPTRFFYDRLARFQIAPHETLTAQLAARGYAPSDVRIAVMSHLHEDHIGGIRELPEAEFVISNAEWETMDQALPEPRGFLRRHIDLPGLRYRKVDFEPMSDSALAPFRVGHDLMGDGSLVLLPTPGHTPGSMSLLVRRRVGAPLLMVGDLTYEAELLEAGRIPGVGSKSALRSTSTMIRELGRSNPGLAVLAAHDPGAADRLDRANWSKEQHRDSLQEHHRDRAQACRCFRLPGRPRAHSRVELGDQQHPQGDARSRRRGLALPTDEVCAASSGRDARGHAA